MRYSFFQRVVKSERRNLMIERPWKRGLEAESKRVGGGGEGREGGRANRVLRGEG